MTRATLAAAAVFPVALTALAAMTAELGWTAWAVAFGFLAVSAWALWWLLAALTRPGWDAMETAALRGGTDLEGLLDAIPRIGDRQ